MDGISLEPTSLCLTEAGPGRAAERRREPGLRPALFARYGDLAKIRYDYPLVLIDGEAAGLFLRSLSEITDGILRQIAPQGAGGERMRRHVLGLEDEIRALVSRGSRGSLSQLWQLAEANLLTRVDQSARSPLGANLDRARDALDIDGEIIDCDEDTPVKVLVHAWNAVQAAKAKSFRKKVEGLILKLSDILKADFMKSGRARSPQALQSSVGTAYEADFDFEAMSRVLTRDSADDLLPEDRRQRIRAVLMVLQSQRFYAPGRASGTRPGQVEPYSFVFDNCGAALDAFRDRLAEMVDLVKAISMAELEIRNRYRTSLHDQFFARFDENALGEAELALFPSFLICLRDGRSDAADTARAFEALASNLPVKILIQTDDILGEPSPEPPRSSFGGGSTRLAAMALGVNNAYVFQAPGSNLYRSRERLLAGLTYEGPALFSIFSGATPSVPGVPPYLLAAAAMESRAFPTFTYDPAAGPDLASRFHVGDNPQAAADWPVHELSYEDEDHQRVTETVTFTQADFAACDARYAKHCRPVPRAKWHDAMAPLGECLALDGERGFESAPYVLMVDADNVLRRTVVDDKLVRAARHCNEMWRSLQEQGGINNSHARRMLDRERQTWEDEKERALAELRNRAEPAPAAVPSAPAPAAVPAAPAETAVPSEVAEPEPVAPGDPYIETPRCTTCHECIHINGKLFAYDENMQAYIADPDAGTYRQLVEAAESCQVCIIHPGKPRDPNESNLDDLLKRAEPFM